MSIVRELTTTANPSAVLAAVNQYIGFTEKVHEEELETGEGTIAIAVYEQYFARVKNRIALMIIADDLQNHTSVRIIATGASQGLVFNIDWGAASSYAAEAERIINRL